MTPKEFLIVRAKQKIIIKQATKTINLAREIAERCPLPANLRPAVESDLVKGAIIWYTHSKSGDWDGCIFWKDVDKHHFADAYMADDGAMYFLDGAYVEIKDMETDQ